MLQFSMKVRKSGGKWQRVLVLPVGGIAPGKDSPSATTTYCVTVTDGCETTPATACDSVIANPDPVVSFVADTTSGCYPITVNFTNTTNPALVGSVFWDFGNGSTTTSTGTVGATYPDPICYDVSLTVTTSAGCVSTLTQPSMICPDDYPTAISLSYDASYVAVALAKEKSIKIYFFDPTVTDKKYFKVILKLYYFLIQF